MSCEIIRVDYQNSEHTQELTHQLNEYCKTLLGFAQELPKENLEKLVPGLKSFENSFALLARKDGTWCGFAICFKGFSTFKGMPLVNIHDLGVLPAYRNQGVGRALMQAIEAISRESGCCKITLETQTNNAPSQALYHSLGYQGTFLDDAVAGPQLFLTKELGG